MRSQPPNRMLSSLTLVLLLAVLLLPASQASGQSRQLKLSDGTLTVTVTYDSVLETDELYTMAIEVDWNGTTQDHVLYFELAGKRYQRTLKSTHSSYAQPISKNTFDKDQLNSNLTVTLKQGDTTVASVEGVVDINFQQADDMIYLYLGYTLVWLGVFGYILFLHFQQNRLEGITQKLKIKDGESEVRNNDDQ